MEQLRNREISTTVRQSLVRLGYKGQLDRPQLVRKAQDMDLALEFLNTRKEESGKQKPVRFDDIVDKLALCRIGESELCFFSPWGPRYKIKTTEIGESSPEIATLREVKEILEGFIRYGFEIRFLVMPADTYGTDINGLSESFVNGYFNALSNVIQGIMRPLTGEGKLNISFVPWSRIKGENLEEYSWIKANISEMPIDNLIRDALRKARIMNPDNIDRSAKRYVEERVTEAILIGQLYDPIKLSLVKKENDAADLQSFMRVYVIKNKAPWMSSDTLEGLLRSDEVI
jgi:hypothetical protein